MPDLIMCGFFLGQQGIGVKENGPDVRIRPGKIFPERESDLPENGIPGIPAGLLSDRILP